MITIYQPALKSFLNGQEELIQKINILSFDQFWDVDRAKNISAPVALELERTHKRGMYNFLLISSVSILWTADGYLKLGLLSITYLTWRGTKEEKVKECIWGQVITKPDIGDFRLLLGIEEVSSAMPLEEDMLPNG